MYVWIGNEDQIFIAEVVNNFDGTLTATYESSFPGTYSVHIEVVMFKRRDEGVPITGSPFELTIRGKPSINLETLAVCGTDDEEDISSTFWRTGTWISSNIASKTHGVLRDGWVFQPRTCVHDTFSYEDIVLLANMEQPTWILILGGSVQRGVFLTLVDMALAQGQKDDFDSSALAKCWGYADIKMGNLRLTYQASGLRAIVTLVGHSQLHPNPSDQALRDFRLYTVVGAEDATVCNNEKLESGSTAAYVRSCKHFLDWVVFKEEENWPSLIMAPSNMVDSDTAPNLPIEVVMAALPETWRGKLLMVDHMAGFANHWAEVNPTRTALDDVDITYHRQPHTIDNGLGKMARYQEQDPRTSFMSMFPMGQAKLYENQNTRHGKRQYAGSVHYHYMSSNSSVEAYGGAKMVHSTITEMISNILFAKIVGTKAALYADAAQQYTPADGSTFFGDTFTMCTDCPSGLLPFHVKPNPNPVCEKLKALPGDAPKGQVWDNELCPDWCLATAPVSQKATESGPVDVRVCAMEIPSP
eukprot:jgi/Undpi1/13013/HiC_scaffold_7.g02677.m1